VKKPLFHMLVIAGVGLVSYANTFTIPFHFDDRRVIAENTFIRDITHFYPHAVINTYYSQDEYNPRRYLGYLSFALNYRWGGLDVRWYHVTNLIIHIINAILVYGMAIMTFSTPYFSDRLCSSRGRPTGHVRRAEPASQAPGNGELSRGKHALLTTRDLPSEIAVFSALLFVGHPLQTQAVTYIVQRFTSLATLFYLLAMVLYIRGRLITEKERGVRQETKNGEQGKRKSFFRSLNPMFYYAGAFVSVVCAMKTKEISFTLPLMILLCEVTFFLPTSRRKLLLLVPVLLTLIIIPLSVIHLDKPLTEILSGLGGMTRLDTDMPRGDYLITEMRVIVTYIRLVFFPINQNIDYDYPAYWSFFSPQVFLSFLFLAALLGTAAYLLYKTHSAKRTVQSGSDNIENSQRYAPGSLRLVAFGICWFFLALSVESSVIPILDVMFEHRIYLPSAGAFIALSAAFFAGAEKVRKRWLRAEIAVVFLAGMIVLVLSATTFVRNSTWQDEMGFWEDVVRKGPGSARAHNNLGFLYNEKGMTDQAIEQLTTAVRLRPEYLDARINLGIAYNEKGMTDQAIEQFMAALRIKPDDADAHNNAGIAYVARGMIAEGITHYQTAVKLRPDYAEAYNNLGAAYGARGMPDAAIPYFAHAIQLKPDYGEAHYNLALAYAGIHDLGKAYQAYKRLVKINPKAAKILLPKIQDGVSGK